MALRHLAEGFGKRTGILVTFGDETAGTQLGRDRELALYRIAQEALTNVLRHANSRAVSVILATTAGGVRLTVSDDGRNGPERSDAAHGGVGIASMRERVRALGGRLQLTFRRTGSVLTAMLPQE